MLDLQRLQRLHLVRRPFSQQFFGSLLHVNYRWLPGVKLSLENVEKIPEEPVIFAMNHTDRYNYFSFQYLLLKTLYRFTATLVKGKYYENCLRAQFMESMLLRVTSCRFSAECRRIRSTGYSEQRLMSEPSAGWARCRPRRMFPRCSCARHAIHSGLPTTLRTQIMPTISAPSFTR